MTTIKEMAEAEYPETMESRPLRVACIGAYLAGAKAALEVAAAVPHNLANDLRLNKGDEFGYFNAVKSTLYNVANSIRSLLSETDSDERI